MRALAGTILGATQPLGGGAKYSEHLEGCVFEADPTIVPVAAARCERAQHPVLCSQSWFWGAFPSKQSLIKPSFYRFRLCLLSTTTYEGGANFGKHRVWQLAMHQHPTGPDQSQVEPGKRPTVNYGGGSAFERGSILQMGLPNKLWANLQHPDFFVSSHSHAGWSLRPIIFVRILICMALN